MGMLTFEVAFREAITNILDLTLTKMEWSI